MRKFIASLVLALMLITALTVPAIAATTQDVTITATPTFISISNAPSTWTINGITGDSKMDLDTVYYANPLGDTTVPSTTVVDGECRFTLTNTSNVATDITVNCGHFTGGDAMQNSDDGSNGANAYGGHENDRKQRMQGWSCSYHRHKVGSRDRIPNRSLG